MDKRRILIAKDNEGNIHAVLFMILTMILHIIYGAGANPEFRSSEAQKYLLWEAI